MIILDCGIELPEPAPNVHHKPDKMDYEKCLSRLVEVIGQTVGVTVGYIHHNPHIAARFIGEMRLAGYIKYVYHYRGKTDDTNTDAAVKMTEARIMATTKLHKVPVEEIHHVPTEPVETFKGKHSMIQVRRGVESRNNKLIKQNPTSYAVVKEIRKQKFRINKYVLDILGAKPALLESDDGFIMYQRCMHYAHQYKDRDYFYFPQYLDSRGREYDETTIGFSPQGADHEKALVLPCYEEVLTKDGYEALLEALYGCSEQDWSVEEMISHARDPIGTHYIWKIADSKYSYIALAKILMDYHDDPTQPLPAFTPLDGRCSGLQHWSALTCSTAITNRLGMEPKEADDGLDIYEYVAEQWKYTLPIDLQHYATRKAAKIPVMTFGYNATRMTSIEHISSLYGEVSEWNAIEGRWAVTQEGLKRAEAASLGSDLYNRLRETLKAFVEAVQWLGVCAKTIDREVINWTTPDGFVGQQKKTVKEDVRIRVTLSNGKEMEVIHKHDTKRPDKRRHASALSPNIIHSLDATHLRMVARRLAELGLPMVFIHDSFATHSNHRHTLYRIIIEEFIKLYSGNYLQDLKEEWERLYEVELPEPPERGDWDVNILNQCEWFFA